MGLDLILGGMILLAALRGWFKGFALQAIRLSGLVACVYAADPVRDQVKPYLVAHLPTIRPDLVDRLLWWASAGVSYVVLVGLACLIVKVQRKQSIGLEERNRLDEFGGFVLGAAKGLVIVVFLVAGLQKYAASIIQNVPWTEEQARKSKALAWNETYHPADRIWAAPPVQMLVRHVQRMGLNVSDAPPSATDSKAVSTAIRTPTLQWPKDPVVSPTGPDADLNAEIARALEAVRAELARPTPRN